MLQSWKRLKTSPIRDLTSPRLCGGPGNGAKRARSGISPPLASSGGPETAKNEPDPGSHLPPPLSEARKQPKMGPIPDLTSRANAKPPLPMLSPSGRQGFRIPRA